MPIPIKITDGLTSTKQLFTEGNGLLFEVHPPQRRFKWRELHVRQLWEDLSKAQANTRDSYFLGTLLLAPREQNTLSVIDGQQRLTTVSLLLAVLRDQCSKYQNLGGMVHTIQGLIGRVDNYGEPVGPLAVTLQDADNDTYVRLTKEPGSTSHSINGKSRLETAVRELKKLVEEHTNVPDAEESLGKLCDFVLERIQFLPLQVRSEGEGYLVFDTTNTRGLRLSPAEALKARLAASERADGNLSENLIEKWNGVASSLERRIADSDSVTKAIDAMDDYLHAVWCAREGYTRKSNMDQPMAKKLSQPGRVDLVRDFVEELETYCQSYLAVIAPSERSTLTEDLRDLKHLNKQSFSFLTMVHKHVAERFQEAVSLVLSLQIRNISVGPQQAHVFEKDWPAWAGHVREGRTDQALRDIRSRMLSDEEFERLFSKVEVNSPATARHLLRRLDPISQPGSGVQPMDVHVEHILPKAVVDKLTEGKRLTPKVRGWIEDLGREIPETREEEQALGEELNPYLNRLGNQALLNAERNRVAKDSRFSDKRAFYITQALELTKALSKHEEWGLKQIQERQEELAKRAVKIWPK